MINALSEGLDPSFLELLRIATIIAATDNKPNNAHIRGAWYGTLERVMMDFSVLSEILSPTRIAMPSSPLTSLLNLLKVKFLKAS